MIVKHTDNSKNSSSRQFKSMTEVLASIIPESTMDTIKMKLLLNTKKQLQQLDNKGQESLQNKIKKHEKTLAQNIKKFVILKEKPSVYFQRRPMVLHSAVEGYIKKRITIKKYLY